MIDTNLIKSDPKKIFEGLKSKKYDLNIFYNNLNFFFIFLLKTNINR